ncbi:LytTR family transcriptional regulator [Pedobacter hiemivivus]|uniref:LytTR family transcriptional regulator n=1 Tax=Pedobacter hiemivivus TaxID=2530454 RepID=A0A4U1GE79_9SPHI|nr:LytTR family DNA-binding domain-containing protein [Pedobacter hiemivivus]TKC62228.1 LytTR family transcriptional regulator [Pedobacter hiemivivus]
MDSYQQIAGLSISLPGPEIADQLTDLLTKLSFSIGKQSFLVFKHNKYFTIATKNIAFFHLKYDCTIITCFDGQEYTVDHSLEQIQSLLAQQFFFRLNRQYLINFYAVKEAEHYFGRKLFVRLSITTQEKLIVSKEKVTCFLHWLENR